MKKALLGTLAATMITTVCMASDEEKLNDIQFGYNQSSGNTDTDSLIVRARLRKEIGNWDHEARLEAIRATRDDQRSAENYIADLQTSRNYGKSLYAFANLRYANDKFAGFRIQASLTGGMGWHVIDSDDTKFDVEGGLGDRYSKEQETGNTVSELVFLGRAKWRHQWTESTTLLNDFRMEGGASNTFIENEAGARVAINSSLGLKVSHIIRHNTSVPFGNKRTDIMTAVTLDYRF